MFSSIDDPRPVPLRGPQPQDDLADSWFDHRRPGSDRPPHLPAQRPSPSTFPPPSIDPVLDDWFH